MIKKWRGKVKITIHGRRNEMKVTECFIGGTRDDKAV